jgi:thiosulfate reductase cytochrome b subunit
MNPSRSIDTQPSARAIKGTATVNTVANSTGPMPSLTIHPVWLRVAHWLNAVAVVVMVSSGWRIYNAAPIFNFRFPREIALGGWLGGALQWHFAGMWLLALNGLVYLALNVFSGRFKRKFLPLRAAVIWNDLRDALHGRLSHANPRHYNGLQRVAYLGVILDLLLLVLSGLVLWKSVQFPLLRDVMGGYEVARRIHFFAMATLVAFVAGHVLMVALVPRTLLAMVSGR